MYSVVYHDPEYPLMHHDLPSTASFCSFLLAVDEVFPATISTQSVSFDVPANSSRAPGGGVRR